MSAFSLQIAIPLLLLAGPPQTGAKPAENRILTEAEVKDLGKLVLKYFRAKEEGKKEWDALQKLTDELKDIEKKRKLPNADYLLKYPKEWERLLDLAEDYSKDALSPGTESVKEFIFGENVKHRYFVSIPKGYKKEDAWPLLIALPENGKDSPKDQFAKLWNDPAFKEAFVVLVPQMPEDLSTWTEPEGYGKALSPFARVSRSVHIDCDRVFLAGAGPGAKAAAAIASFFPSRFAGAILRGEEIGVPVAENFHSLPIYCSKRGGAEQPKEGEEKEGEKKSTEAEAFAKRLDALGYKNFTQGEDSPAAIAAWAAEKTRNNYPTVLAFRPPKAAARAAYWVKIDRWEFGEDLPLEQQPVLKAVVDREKNQVTVTTSGVHTFTLYFNDILLDLDKHVTVVTNGKSWVGTIPRGLQFFLDLSYTRNDNRAVFTGAQRLDTPRVVDGNAKTEKDSK